MVARLNRKKAVRRDVIDSIRHKMELSGLSLRKVAEDAGIAYPYLHGVLAREHSPSMAYLEKVMDVLGLEFLIVHR